MEINFRGTRIRVKTDALVWGKKVPCTEVVVKSEDDADEEFLRESFAPHLQKAISLLGSDSAAVTEIAQRGTEKNNLKIKKLENIVINFDTENIYYDYYFDVGKLFGGFVLHITGTPDGALEYKGIS